MGISLELKYFILFSAVLILPKILLRFRIPTALTALVLGALTSFFLDWFSQDQMILMMSRLGITSLFLFAGMEVNLNELKAESSALLKHIAKVFSLIFLITFGISSFFEIDYRPALILSLGLMTPSTGFILNSLQGISLTETQEKWIRSKAISKELVAIAILFFSLQLDSFTNLLVSLAAILAMILILPLLFEFFLKRIAPFAPDSEATFLILISLLCGVITTKLGTYYLVGAFIVGMTSERFKHCIGRDKSKNILHSISFFFSFFVPFYFYSAGLSLSPEFFSLKGAALGIVFVVLLLPLRFLSVISSLWFFHKNLWKDRVHIALPLLPTLIFGLVIMNILRENFDLPSFVLSGLLIYTITASIIPWFFFKQVPAEAYDVSMIK